MVSPTSFGCILQPSPALAHSQNRFSSAEYIMSIRTAIVLAVASVVSASGVASQKSLCRDLIDFHSRSVKQVSELAKVLTNDSGKTDPITLSVIRLSAVMKADASALKVASANKNEGCLLSGSTGLVESVITEYINAFESLSKPVAGATGVIASIMPEFARKQMMAWKDMLTRVHMSNAFSQLGMYDTLTSKIFGKFASPIMDRSGSKSFRGIGRSRGGLDRRSHQSLPPHPEAFPSHSSSFRGRGTKSWRGNARL